LTEWNPSPSLRLKGFLRSLLALLGPPWRLLHDLHYEILMRRIFGPSQRTRVLDLPVFTLLVGATLSETRDLRVRHRANMKAENPSNMHERMGTGVLNAPTSALTLTIFARVRKKSLLAKRRSDSAVAR
jgi:hypothetical protein